MAGVLPGFGFGSALLVNRSMRVLEKIKILTDTTDVAVGKIP